MPRKLVTDRELHEIYPCLSLWAINQLRREGKIPYIQLPGVRRFYFDVDTIEKYFDNLQAQSMQPETSKIRAVR